MSDERDETRPLTPRPGSPDDETRMHRPSPSDDETRLSAPDDETRVSTPDDATRLSAADDATRVGGASDDETIADTGRPRTDATSVMPPSTDDDWARSRANPAWSGRAEVRTPQRRTYQEPDDWAETVGREPRDRWWMPIVVGIIALVLLTVLGLGIYLIVQNSGDDETPTAPTPPTVAPTQTLTSAPSAPPSTEPTTNEPSPTPSTTNPTVTQVTIPALKGLPLQAAETALSSMNLRWHVIYLDNDALPGTVIDSDPAEGQEVPPDTRVTLVVAQGGAPPSTGPTAGSSGGPGE